MTRLSLLKTPAARRKGNREVLLQRLQECLREPGNAACADCAEEKPAWASLLQCPASKGGIKMGVFCCYKCVSYHYQLGRDVCTVKNIKVAEDWTDEEVKAMETSGNALANAIYEADSTDDTKEQLLRLTGREEEDARETFLTNKYQKRRFFNREAYQKHMSWSEVDKEANPAQRRAHQQDIESITGAKRVSVTKNEDKEPTTEPALGSDDPVLGDSSGVLDLGYNEQEDQEDLARVLAQRAMCSGGAIRRGSFNGGLMGRVGNNMDDSQRGARRRPRRTKSSDLTETGESRLQRRNSKKSLFDGDDTESEVESICDDRRAKRRIRRTQSSDLAETGEPRLQRRNSNRSLLLDDDTECESEAESVRDERKARRRGRRSKVNDAELEAMSSHSRKLERRGSNRKLLVAQEDEQECQLKRRGSNRNLLAQEDGQLKRRGSNRKLLAAQEDGQECQLKRRGSNRNLLAQEDGQLKRRGSSRKLLAAQEGGQERQLKRRGSNRKLLIAPEDGQADTTSRRSSFAERESWSTSSSRGSPGQIHSHCSSHEEETLADRKARRRSGRRHTTSRVTCESPTSVQSPDNVGHGSSSHSAASSDGSSGPRPRRRPSLNGALVFAMSSAPRLS